MPKRIVITGASSEIGQSICKRVIKKGDEAILQCFRNKERCIHLRDVFGDSCKIVSVDFNDANELDNFCKTLNDVDILINVAAVTLTDLLVNLTDDSLNRMINVNIIATVKLCKAVIPSMVAKRSGCIVNLSSIAAQRGSQGQNVYAGTKGFIESFTRSLTAEYGQKGVRVNCVAPGPIEAGSLKELLSYARDEVVHSTVSKKLGKPEDVASAIAFLCSEEASFINGRCISVDGGFCRGV